MTDRLLLLKAIDENYTEDTPRLMYADWLDEHGTGDLDKATSEFVRVSCSRRVGSGKRMPKEAYKWLDDNWVRLVPTLVAQHTKTVATDPEGGRFRFFHPGPPMGIRTGRCINTRVGIPNPYYTTNPLVQHLNETARTPIYSCSVNILFWKGFVSTFHCWSSFSRPIFTECMKEDQPLAYFSFEDRSGNAKKATEIIL